MRQKSAERIPNGAKYGARITQAMFSSDAMDWETPPSFVRRIDALYHFTLDAAATGKNRKFARYISPQMDSLHTPWRGRAFCNPPYGDSVGPFMHRAMAQVRKGPCELAAMLVPSRTDPIWWHQTAMQSDEIVFLEGRLRMRRPGVRELTVTPFPNCLVVFRKDARQKGGADHQQPERARPMERRRGSRMGCGA